METQIFYGIIAVLLAAAVGLLVRISSALNFLSTQVAVLERELEKGAEMFHDHESRIRTLEHSKQ